MLLEMGAGFRLEAGMTARGRERITEKGTMVFGEGVGFPKFTNEVQHFIQVLLWDTNIRRSPLKSGVRFPDYIPRDKHSGKSLQVWIARHRLLLGS